MENVIEPKVFRRTQSDEDKMWKKYGCHIPTVEEILQCKKENKIFSENVRKLKELIKSDHAPMNLDGVYVYTNKNGRPIKFKLL